MSTCKKEQYIDVYPKSSRVYNLGKMLCLPQSSRTGPCALTLLVDAMFACLRLLSLMFLFPGFHTKAPPGKIADPS